LIQVQALGERLLLMMLDVSLGSASAGRARDLTAGKPPPKLSDRIADVRGRQWLAISSHS